MTGSVEFLLAQLRAFPAELLDLIQGYDDADLQRAAAGGGWGSVEIFCHLRDADALATERIQRILSEDEPYIPAVDETLWPIERDYASQNARAALDEFDAIRQHFVTTLETLTANQLDRRGYHEDHGEQTVREYIDNAIQHDADHRQQLLEVLGDSET
ncbi:MAG: DinB family protein [Thermomicrobiales bacterium]|nr:DinB family protein [Thermomicrobiales bacterium]